MPRTVLLSVAFNLLLVPLVQAEKNASIKPLLGTTASPTITETFDTEVPSVARSAKGAWEVVDGVLIGKELTADKHAAVLSYTKPNHNSIVRFSFKVGGDTKGFNFSLNHKGGHLCRVVVAPTKMTINLDKDKKDPKSKAKILATAKGDFSKNQWHTMQVELVGDKVVAQVDNGVVAKASHEKLDTNKPGYRWVMRGDSLSIDDLHIWELPK
jgi:hypothetical protein